MQIKSEFKEQYLKEIEMYNSYVRNIFMLYSYQIHISNFLNYPIRNDDNKIFLYAINMLLKDQIALDIWKILIDNDKNSNTFQHLNNNIKNKYLIDKHDYKSIKLKISNEVRKKISNIRNHFLAHADSKSFSDELSMNELKPLIVNVISTFNNLLYDEAQKYTLTKQILEAQEKSAIIGVKPFHDVITGDN